MLGVYGLYDDGWILSAKPLRAPWEINVAAVPDPGTAYQTELYDLSRPQAIFNDSTDEK